MSNNHILVITGAGISVESGIKPFRGKGGIWEENPTEMATYKKFSSSPIEFLTWYYYRFVSCKDALPNDAHKILAENNIKVITQNIDNLHRKAKHPTKLLIEIHGNINIKRKINCTSIAEFLPADWNNVNENNLANDLMKMFNLLPNGKIDVSKSYRPHVLLFDEFYTDLYESSIAIDWINEAQTIIFMGTSNSVGITVMALDIALRKNKNIIVADPNPSPSFKLPNIKIYEQTASKFCKNYFS